MGFDGSAGIMRARMLREDKLAELEREVKAARERALEAEAAREAWETAHELEYKVLFAQGERAALNALDAEWNALEDEARWAAEEWHDAADALTVAREARSW